MLTLIILGLVFSVFSFLPFLKVPWWWVRILDFPRLHIAIILLLILTVYSLEYATGSTQDYVLIALWSLAILNQIRYIYNFTPLARIEALKTDKQHLDSAFNLMISNVRMVNTEYQKFLELVLKQDPDMLIMNEPNEAWHQSVRGELDKRFPYSIKNPLENTYGMMLYSKFKLHNPKIRYLVEADIPSFYAIVELPSGKYFDLFTVHPQPPRLLQDTETREAELLLVAKEAKQTKYPSVVAGDLNDVAWSRTTKLFKQISSLIDPRVGRGFFNTYNAHIPLFRYPLDHVFYDPAFRLAEITRLPKFGSDHFPISITLNYEPQNEEEQIVPVADVEDQLEAEELIKEGLEKAEELNKEKKYRS